MTPRFELYQRDLAVDEQSLFLQALEKPSGDERAAWLKQACGPDAALRERIERLLRQHDEASGFLEQPVLGLDPTIVPDASEDRATSLDAGLATAFEPSTAVVIGDANHSVLKMLGKTLDAVPQVSLRESAAEGEDPVARPSSPEMPKSDSDSRYQLQGEIARGGMGAIIKGRDTDLGRDLAIKVLLDSHKHKPEVIQRFVEEAQIGGQLQHPGIAPVYELGQFNDQRPFFSMKLVKGQTLAKLLADRKDPVEDRSRFIAIFEQVCQTMAYAHSRGVIHRDLKPANIMVGAFGEVQVMDWGLAKVLPAGGVADEKRSRMKSQGQSIIQTLRNGVGSDAPAVGSVGSAGSHTQMGSVMGTPAYMPPEQALGEIDVMDERADVFGLGAILCEILTGKPPYVGDDGTQIFRLASRGKLADCLERLDACGADEDLIALTKHCLELEPDDRPGNAGVLAERVTEYLESVESRLRQAEMERAAQAARADAEAAQVEAERQHAQAESRRAEAECQRAESERLRLVQQQHATRKLKRALMGLAVVALLALVASVVAVRAKRFADLANIEAQQQAAAAERSAMAEKDSAQRARRSAQDANREAKRAAKKEAEAVAAQRALQQQNFFADITLAQYAYEAGNANEVSRRLLQCVPNDDEQDRRGVEWRLWWNATHQVQRVIPTPNGAQVFELAISPDGKLAADSHGRIEVRLRETANPDKIKTFPNPGIGEINRLAFSSDSSMLLTVGEYRRLIHRYSTEDASLLGKVEAPVRLRDLSFSPTENQLVSGGADGRLYFWDTITWERSDAAVSDDSLPIWSVAYSPDGSLIVAGTDGAGSSQESGLALGYNSPLVLLDSARSIRSTAQGHTARITSVAWSPDGQLIASASADATVRVWTKDLSPLGTLDSGSWVTQVAFSPDGKYLAAGTDMDNGIRVWKTDDWEPATTLKGHSKSVTSIAFDPRRGDLWSASEDTTIKTWSIEQSLGVPGVVLDDETLRTMLGNAYRTSVTGDGRTLFCCKPDGAIERYDLATQTTLPAWKERTLYKLAAFSDDGRIVATADESTKLVQAWRLDDEELIAEVPISPEEVSTLHTLCVSRDAKRIGWTAGKPLHLVLVDTESGDQKQAPLRFQKEGTREWREMSISADAKWLYVKIGYDVWVMEIDDFVTGVEAEPTDINVGDIGLSYWFAFSDDGRLGVAPNFFGRIPLRDLNTGQASHMLVGHSGEVRYADFTDDSRRVLSGGEDGTVKIWDVTTGDSLATLRGHAGPVNWVGSRNEDSQIISLSRADGTVRIWNAATEEEIWQNPVNWVELARHHEQANRLANAIAAYDRAVELAPDDPGLRFSRIELNGRMVRFAAVMADYLGLIAMGKASPDDVIKARTLPRSLLVAGALEQPLFWCYTFAQPSDDWTKPGFDDDSWDSAPSPFGSSARDATAWTGDDIWLRCQFDLAATVSDPIVFSADCDDMANFYLNGVHAARGGGGQRSQTIPCSEQAAATLKPGRNVLAIHCHNSGGDARIDAGLFIGRTLGHWIDLLTTALDEDPSNVHLLQTRAQAYRERGDDELAAADEDEAVVGLRTLVKMELDSPDVAWPTYAPQLADLLILQGEAHAALGRRDEANDHWRRAMELDESVLQGSFDRLRQAGKWRAAARLGMFFIEQDPEDRIRWLNVAPLLVMADDEQGYREFCDAMVKQFSETNNQTKAANTCKACLLLPDAVDLSKLPVKVFADALDAGTTGPWLRPRAWAARALVAYRSGDFDLASMYLREGWASEPDDPTRALNYAIAALERQGRGDSEGSREALGHVRRILDQHLPNAKAGQLHNWLIPQILADEAEGLLNDEGESSEAKRTAGSD